MASVPTLDLVRRFTCTEATLKDSAITGATPPALVAHICQSASGLIDGRHRVTTVDMAQGSMTVRLSGWDLYRSRLQPRYSFRFRFAKLTESFEMLIFKEIRQNRELHSRISHGHFARLFDDLASEHRLIRTVMGGEGASHGKDAFR